MKVFKLAVLDIFQGTWLKLRYLIFVFVLLMFFGNFQSMMDSYIAMSGDAGLTLADSLAFVCQGIAPASENAGMESFVMPVAWLLFMMLQLLMPLDHPVHSMELWGSQYLARTGRRSWWFSKSIYILAVNLLAFGIYLCTAVLFCAAHGIKLTMDGSAGFYKMLFGAADLSDFQMLSISENILLLIVLPLAAICAMSMIQLFISVWFHPIAAYLVTVSLLVLSVFFRQPWLLGNHGMAIRSAMIDSSGILTSTAVLWCVGFYMAAFFIGLICIRKKDMSGLKKEET